MRDRPIDEYLDSDRVSQPGAVDTVAATSRHPASVRPGEDYVREISDKRLDYRSVRKNGTGGVIQFVQS